MMTHKPEPWWPITWSHWRIASGTERADLNKHPTFDQVESVKDFPSMAVRFRYPPREREIRGHATKWYFGVDEVTLRSMLLSFAYPEGNDGT